MTHDGPDGRERSCVELQNTRPTERLLDVLYPLRIHLILTLIKGQAKCDEGG